MGTDDSFWGIRPRKNGALRYPYVTTQLPMDTKMTNHAACNNSPKDLNPFVEDLAKKLKENGTRAIPKLDQLVRDLGVDKAKELLNRAIGVKDSGGMKIRDESKQRTLGGIFFFLAKSEQGWVERKGEVGSRGTIQETKGMQAARFFRRVADHASRAADCLHVDGPPSAAQARQLSVDAIHSIKQILVEIAILMRIGAPRRISNSVSSRNQRQKPVRRTNGFVPHAIQPIVKGKHKASVAKGSNGKKKVHKRSPLPEGGAVSPISGEDARPDGWRERGNDPRSW